MSAIYPNLETICRLCLSENAGVVEIFSKHSVDGSNISIPMRLMACAALEVQNVGEMPSKICVSCRFELEKAYYFRRRSQASDVKLRKHLRLLSMGKKSKVFVKPNKTDVDEDDDDDDDELEFKESLDFIKARELEIAQSEEKRFEMYKKQIKAESEEYLKTLKSTLENEISERLQNKLTPLIRKKLKDECLEEAKQMVYDEVRRECREKEVNNLLTELEEFFKYKKSSLQILATPPKDQTKINENLEEIKTLEQNKKELKLNKTNLKMCMVKSSKEISNITNNIENMKSLETRNKKSATGKEFESNDELDYMTYNNADEDILNMAQDSDSNSSGCKKLITMNSHALMEMHSKHPISDGEEDFHSDSTEDPQISTISYQIKGDDNGEITFLKKTSQLSNAVDNNSEGSIMVIDFTDNVVDNLNLIEIDNRKDEHNDCTKEETKTTTAITTVHTTMLSKTYSNSMQRITDTAKIFKCSDCPMEFSMQKALERHVRAHRKSQETGVTYECSKCHCVLSCNSALRRHMNVHSEQKPYVCRECGKGFVQKEILKRHSLTHTGIKPHRCSHCDKAFTQRVSLTQHINRHHAEKPLIERYSCPLCPKTFFHASGLSRHLASHSGVAYQCTECERTFGDRSSVKRHIANVHGKGNLSKTNINA